MAAVTAVTIVLLPGLDGTGDLFERFVAVAPSGVRPVVVSFPHATSYPDLRSVVRHQLPSVGSFVVLGESFSGPLAMPDDCDRCLSLQSDQVAKVSAPVLLLVGEHDRLISTDVSSFERVTTNLTVRPIPGPHLLLQAAPQEAWSEISKFLDA
jgi:hypothetical protein